MYSTYHTGYIILYIPLSFLSSPVLSSPSLSPVLTLTLLLHFPPSFRPFSLLKLIRCNLCEVDVHLRDAIDHQSHNPRHISLLKTSPLLPSQQIFSFKPFRPPPPPPNLSSRFPPHRDPSSFPSTPPHYSPHFGYPSAFPTTRYSGDPYSAPPPPQTTYGAPSYYPGSHYPPHHMHAPTSY